MLQAKDNYSSLATMVFDAIIIIRVLMILRYDIVFSSFYHDFCCILLIVCVIILFSRHRHHYHRHHHHHRRHRDFCYTLIINPVYVEKEL